MASLPLSSSNAVLLPPTSIGIESLQLSDMSNVSVVGRNEGGCDDSGPETDNSEAVLEAGPSPPPGAVVVTTRPEQSLWVAALIMATLSGLTFTSSMTTGLLTIGLPNMAVDLALTDALLLW